LPKPDKEHKVNGLLSKTKWRLQLDLLLVEADSEY
jgi:hypothetical protein